MRRGVIDRTTKETSIALRLTLEGRGRYDVRTGIRFFDHMLELFTKHGGFDLKLEAQGDLDVDQHHTVEDVGIVLGCGPVGLAVIAALANGDRDAFYAAETEARRDAGAPPFGRWAAIILSSEDEREAREAAVRLGDVRPRLADAQILGPAPAPLALLRGRYRYRFLVNARRSANLQAMLRDWIGGVTFAPGVRVGVDIDPYSFV